MLDPAVYTAFVVIVAWLLKLGFEALGIPMDEQTYNTLAAAIVTALLAWLAGNLFKAGARKVAPGLFERNLLGK